MKLLSAALMTLTLTAPAHAHYGPDVSQTKATGLTLVQTAISQPVSPTWPQIPVAGCPVNKADQVQVACAK